MQEKSWVEQEEITLWLLVAAKPGIPSCVKTVSLGDTLLDPLAEQTSTAAYYVLLF